MRENQDKRDCRSTKSKHTLKKKDAKAESRDSLLRPSCHVYGKCLFGIGKVDGVVARCPVG